MEVGMSLQASDIMTGKVVTVGPEDSVKNIAAALCGHDISGGLVGIVSEGDLMQPFGTARMLKRAWWLDLLAEGDDLAPDFLKCDLMSSPVVTASEDTPISELADLMTNHRIKRVPIMRASRFVGVISLSDIVRTLIDSATNVTPSA
jgi:CBS domain-containing protein